MKTKFTLLLSFVFYLSSFILMAQPQGFNYQAVVLNASGNVVASHLVGFRFSILDGGGSSAYTETQSATTNAQGMVNLVIGSGTLVSGNFATINWSTGGYSLKVEMDPAGGTSYTLTETKLLRSVPYALYSPGSGIWAKNGSNIYFNTGSVGIGTQTPYGLLHLKGTSPTNSVLYIEPSEWNSLGDYGELRLGDLNHYIRGEYSGGMTLYDIDKIQLMGSNVGIGTYTPSGKLSIDPGASWSDDVPLFEVKNKSGMTVFAVYNNGVRIFVEDDAPYKGSKSGFAVGGFNPAKGGYTNDFLWVTPDSVRVYVDNSVTKGTKGGFAVGGFNPSKGTTPVSITHLTDLNYSIGHEAGISLTSGKYNTFFGYQSGRKTTGGTPSGFSYPGWANVFIGYQTGYSNTTGFKNVFLGFQSGMDNVDGYYNTFIGNAAGTNNTTGVKNTFVGNESGEANVSGSYNTCFGYNSGIMTSGDYNTFVGADCGFYNTTGGANAYFGNHAGEYLRGSFNTILGAFAGRNYATISSGSNNIFIGAYAGYNSGAVSNKLYIDPTNTSSPLIGGDFSANMVGINRMPTTYTLEVGGTIWANGSAIVAGSTTWSDIRYKKDIEPLSGTLEKILAITGVSYNWREEDFKDLNFPKGHQIGVIAQDIEKVLPELVYTDPNGYKSVSYEKLTPVLVEAIKEQQKIIDEQKIKMSELEKRLEKMEERLGVVTKEE